MAQIARDPFHGFRVGDFDLKGERFPGDPAHFGKGGKHSPVDDRGGDPVDAVGKVFDTHVRDRNAGEEVRQFFEKGEVLSGAQPYQNFVESLEKYLNPDS